MKSRLYTFLSLLTLLILGYAFQSSSTTAVEQVARTYEMGLSSFAEEAQNFQSAVHDSATNEEIRQAYIKLRIAYKEIEYLMYYADPEWTKNFINGAPLPHLEPKTSGVFVLEPEGLQRIEELVFEEEIDESTLMQKARTLADNALKFQSFAGYHHFTEREIFEAVRFEIIRVLSQGITGFDTPASNRAIIESGVALGAARDAMLLFEDQLEERDLEFAISFLSKWDDAVTYLESNPDFNSFDRAHFTVEFIEPLFGMTADAQELLYIEFNDETTSMVQSVNHRARRIFSEELINPFYFTQVRESQMDSAKVKLGKSLFFDPALSSNLERSCASCHKPELAFSDGLPKSTAMEFDGTVNRNAPTLVNAVLSPRFFYDLRAQKLEAQFDHVIFNPQEFNSSYAEIVNRLRESSEYVEWFEEVYGPNAQINKRTIETSIAAFIVSLRSFDSSVDRWLRGEVEVEAEVERGYNLFMGKAVCATCHFAPTFSGLVPPYFQEMESEVLGVPADTSFRSLDPDLGRGGSTLKEASEIYFNSFKTVTVRNVELTGPYMHNGVFSTLEEVMNFYNEGGGAGRGLDVPNQTLPFDELKLTPEEISDLIAFMKALTSLPAQTGAPSELPEFEDHPEWNSRVIGGRY